MRRRSSRTASPRARATSSSVSPKRNTTVSTLSAARALSMLAAYTEPPFPAGTRTRDRPALGRRAARSSCGFSASTTSGFAPAARATVASAVPAGTSTSS